MSATTSSSLNIRRLLTGLVVLLALTLSASNASPANASSPKAKAPHAAKHLHGKISSGELRRMRSAANALQAQRSALSGEYVTCDPYQRAYWGYWIRCHVVTGNSGYSYFDGYYEYDYWTGSQWAYWFISNS